MKQSEETNIDNISDIASVVNTCNEMDIPNASTVPISIQSYLELSENRKCIDCNEANPEWCSLSFGVLVCLKCAGLHRSLGAHITLVRSITLDEWNETSHIGALEYGGNLKFIEYLKEHNMNNRENMILNVHSKYICEETLYYREILESQIQKRETKSKEDPMIKSLSMKCINNEIARNNPLVHRMKEPEWIPDTDALICMICECKFDLWKRRHHCRRCGKVVCTDCAPKNNSRPIIEWNYRNAVRHCKVCYKSPTIEWRD